MRASAANEMTRTAAAPQPNSQSGIGSGLRWIGPPWADAVAGAASAATAASANPL